MKQIPIIPGATVTIATLTTHDATGALAAADSTPTLALFQDDGGDDLVSVGGVVITVTDFGAGLSPTKPGAYRARMDVDDFLQYGDMPEPIIVWGYWFWTIGGVQQAAPIEPFLMVPQFTAGYVDSGTNTATTFKVATGYSYMAAWGVDDGLVDMLITFTTGALLGQTRRVSAYNATTGYLTVDTALTGTPANGDHFWLSNF